MILTACPIVIFVDSSVWIDYFRGAMTQKTSQLIDLFDSGELLVGDLVICEVLQGMRSERQARSAEEALREFDFVTLSDPELAIIAAANFRLLRGHGITIRTTIDLIIGTFCIERDHVLLHSDRDFEPMERLLGLRTV